MAEKDLDKVSKTYAQKAAAEKLFAAERHVSVVRLIVVLVNSFIYYTFIDKQISIPWLANFIVFTSIAYAFYIWIDKPYEKYSQLRSSFFTFMSDGILIFIWIIATGMVESPFYLLWAISIIAVAQRYSFMETIATSLIYCTLYLLIIALDIDAPVSSAELAARIIYIPIIGVLGAYFSKEISDQIQDKLKARDAEISAQEAEQKSSQLLDKLSKEIEEKIKAETRLKKAQAELEQRVEERTKELQELNEELKTQVTEKERIEQIQQQTLEKMQDINQELESFAYITSHDLKAPLRGISTIADWLHDDYAEALDEQGQKQLKLLKGRVQKMFELIEGILMYSRVGRDEGKEEKVDTKALVNETLELMHPPKNIEFKVQEDLPEVKSNKTLLTQIFENFISNAIKYMDKENGLIEIGAQEKNGNWEFFVQDNGMGIEEKHHQRIFEMFQTLGTKDANNTGIGLAIVKKVAHKLGSKVCVESKTGKGSTFYFTLPKIIEKTAVTNGN